MTIKEDLELIRGEKINLITIPPQDIPCIETSCSEKICQNPLVSVSMITYNHELYIRQAIESVIDQKTNFEYELIIGEDCSQDKTREICFEYQKKYPDKIRVLWWHENVFNKGGNGRRVEARCRGSFIAYCEGDDYWSDPFKLQKQFDIMTKYPNVTFCFGDVCILNQSTGEFDGRGILKSSFMPGLICGSEYLVSSRHATTCSTMVRVSTLRQVKKEYEIFNWKLAMGDVQCWMALATKGDAYFIPDVVSVYRVHSGGISHGRGSETTRDGCLALLYFARITNAFPYEYVAALVSVVHRHQLKTIASKKTRVERDALLKEFCRFDYQSIYFTGSWLGMLAARYSFIYPLYWRCIKLYLRLFKSKIGWKCTNAALNFLIPNEGGIK